MQFRHISAVLVELMILVTIAVRPVLGNLFSGDVELLKTTALLQKANFESLVTWKGQATEEITATGGKDPDYLTRNNVTFAYDRIRNAVRWNKDPQEFHGAPGAEKYAAEAYFNSSMVVDDKTYYYSLMGWKNDARRHGLVIGDLKLARDRDSSHFDTRLLFAHPVSEEPGYEKLMREYRTAMLPKEKGYDEKRGRRLEGHVRQEGDLVILEAQLTLDADGNKVVDKDIYDLSRGGNLIECYNGGPGGENLYTYEYEEKTGVWIVKSLTCVNKTKGSNGEYRQHTRTVKWGQSTVNVPFAEDEFSLVKMGVKPGDQIHDHRVGMRYTYGSDLKDSELLNPALLVTKGVNEAVGGVKTPFAGRQNRAIGVADANVPIPEGTVVIDVVRGTPVYLVLCAVVAVVGVAGGVYKLTRRLRKE